MEELNELLQQRRAKVKIYEAAGVNPFANDFTVTHNAQQVLEAHAADDKQKLEEVDVTYRIGGRIMARRDFGKAAVL